jgi:deoxyribodipyrimidine photo-lyase
MARADGAHAAARAARLLRQRASPRPCTGRRATRLTRWNLLPIRPTGQLASRRSGPRARRAHGRTLDFQDEVARYEALATCPHWRGHVRACRRICISERFRPPRLAWPGMQKRAVRSILSWANSAGAIMRRTSSCNARLWRPQRQARSSMAFPWRDHEGEAPMPIWPRGSGAHRLSHRRCRDAPAVGDGLDAQPGADDRRQLPDQASADRLARGERWFWDTLVDADYGTTRSTGSGRGFGRRRQHVRADHGAAGQSEKFDAALLYPRMGARTGPSRRCVHP